MAYRTSAAGAAPVFRSEVASLRDTPVEFVGDIARVLPESPTRSRPSVAAGSEVIESTTVHRPEGLAADP